MSADPVIVQFDVTDALPADLTLGERTWITARVFAPTGPRPGRTSVVTCLHGGSYDWRYFHITGAGLSGYSMAEDLAARGHVVIVPDQLGVGDSARPAAPHNAGRIAAASANNAAMHQAYTKLEEGRLHPRVPQCSDPLKVGVGHSMGAMVLITEQARFAGYDLVAPIGYTGFGAHLDVDGDMVALVEPPDKNEPPFKRVDRALLMRTFHWDDTPAEVLAADEAMSVEFLSAMAREAQYASTAEDAAAITRPVFLALGERDVSPDPTAESAYFKASPDVTTFRLERAAHCHNFAPTRQKLWARLDRWITSLT